MSELGFADNGSLEMIRRAPRAEPVAKCQFYQDKFIQFSRGTSREAPGRAVLKEDFVYDIHYRCEIDFTGLRLDLTLPPDAFEAYRQFVGTAPVPASIVDPVAWHGDLVLSIPAPAFDFPAGRGSAAPYPPAGTKAGKVRNLRTIRRFAFETMTIVKSRAPYLAAEHPGARASDTPPSLVLRLT